MQIFCEKFRKKFLKFSDAKNAISLSKLSIKSSFGDNFFVVEFFFAKNSDFFIRLTGKGTSEVTSGTSGDHLLVTSVTQKLSGTLDRVTSENP